jgi:hypothetical protein
MLTNWLDTDGRLLSDECPLPLDHPFTTRQAEACGVSRGQLRRLLAAGLLRSELRGVYAAAQVPNDTVSRTAALSLVINDDAVVCGRTAAWLHGVDLLPRSAITTAPPVEVAHISDTRVRRPSVDGHRRQLVADDIATFGRIRATAPLRTALDLGRLLWRYDALAALDGFLRIGVDSDLLRREVVRFRGYRGVRQLRGLLPLADPRAESPGESALRLNWHEAGLPWPEPQLWVYDDGGEPLYRLDLTDPGVRYAAEYDGQEHHTGEDDREHDAGRRAWLERRGWVIDVFTKSEVYGRHPDPLPILKGGHARARRTHQLWTPGRRVR